MRVVLTAVVLLGCASVSSRPLSPEGPASEPPSARAAQTPLSQPEPAVSTPSASPTRGEPSPSHAETQAEAAPAVELPANVPARPSTVRVLSPGAEPRKALRYVFHRGESMKLHMHQDMTVESLVSRTGVGSTLPTQTLRQILPSSECDGITRTRQVDADGTAHREGYIAGIKILSTPGVEPAIESKMVELFRGVGKLPFDDVIDARGEILAYHMDLSSVSEPSLLEAMKQIGDNMSSLTTPWPEEPVGPGAKWQSKSTLNLSGGVFERTTLVTLTSLRGSKLKLEMTINLLGAPHTVSKGGVSVDVGETRTTATAHLEITLDPVVTQSTSSSETVNDSTANGAHVHIKMNIDTQLYSGP
jgi:hypothetical protein